MTGPCSTRTIRRCLRVRRVFRAKKISFGTGKEKTDVYCREDEIVFGELSFCLRNSALVGEHNKENIMAAVAVAECWAASGIRCRKA